MNFFGILELFQQQPGSFYADLEKILSDDCDGGRKTGKHPVIIETDNGHLFRYGDSPLIQQGDSAQAKVKGTEEDGASALFRPFVR